MLIFRPEKLDIQAPGDSLARLLQILAALTHSPAYTQAAPLFPDAAALSASDGAEFSLNWSMKSDRPEKGRSTVTCSC